MVAKHKFQSKNGPVKKGLFVSCTTRSRIKKTYNYKPTFSTFCFLFLVSFWAFRFGFMRQSIFTITTLMGAWHLIFRIREFLITVDSLVTSSNWKYGDKTYTQYSWKANVIIKKIKRTCQICISSNLAPHQKSDRTLAVRDEFYYFIFVIIFQRCPFSKRFSWNLRLLHLYQYRLIVSLVVECWLRVREVPGSILCQGQRHTKDVIKMVPVVPLFSTEHSKGKILALSQELR